MTAEASNFSIVAPFFIILLPEERCAGRRCSSSCFFLSNAVTCIGPVGLFQTKPTVHSVVINQSQAGWLERATDNLMAPRNKTLSLQQEASHSLVLQNVWVVLLDSYTRLLWLIILQSLFLLNESSTPANEKPFLSSRVLLTSVQQVHTHSNRFICTALLS